MQEITAIFGVEGQTTEFAHSAGRLFLRRLCGIPCGNHSRDEGPQATRGLLVLETLKEQYTADDFKLVSFEQQPDSVVFILQAGDSGLRVTSRWKWDARACIWSRKDTLHNVGAKTQTLLRCLSCFALTPDRYTHYYMSSHWSRENQLQQPEFKGGRLSLHSQGGRTLQGGAPWWFTASPALGRGIALHILPCGDWTIQVDQSRNVGDESAPFVVIETGLSERNLRLELQPGQAIDLPEILIQAVEGCAPEAGAAELQHYALRHIFHSGERPPVKTAPPIVFNTWFDRFDHLDVERLRRQLAAAEAAGCEVFTVDAGWFGSGQGGWHAKVGDWREKADGAFRGKLADLAVEVRAAGLGFGLWVEPERFVNVSPVVMEHPDWFLPGDGGFLYPDLTRVEAYQYVLGELKRLVETYDLRWMKVDFNFELGEPGDALNAYYQRWYALLDELRLAFPRLFLEGCASGGMRSDLNSAAHFDAHFLSDTVNPLDTLRISQGAALRLPQGRLTKWAVLRPLAVELLNDHPEDQSAEQVLTPGGAGWDAAFSATIDFCYLACLPGIPGLSGDLAGLSGSQLGRLRRLNQVYKDWRGFIPEAVCDLLTPVRPLGDATGWVAFLLRQPDLEESLLLVYRLNDSRSRLELQVPGLHEDCEYRVEDLANPEVSPVTLSGVALHNGGLEVHLPGINTACILALRPVRKEG